MEFMTLRQIFKQLFKASLLAAFALSAQAQVMVMDGYVRAMPPSVPNSAAYFTLMNHGPATKLVSVSSPAADEAQLHTLITENELVKMRRLDSLELPEHGTVSLSETGNHIMLQGLKAPLQEGQKIALTLTFADGQSLEITLPVAKQGANAAPHEHHH
ncbi:copper chaperone PCu(A)C [Shewanella cyperi]|uniref:Copper chaperone PCu(A)C n=1 Tax=Shewanella cyperi TaxID=2814292 RepID=A0A974XLL8_9GAMM|nr:copper chaperone PCu(A)C [Shewanella cyperi]QSX29518.1 copper chaperone PCu(A)C [Shewanella cyperi]